ncbi:hypothetical protein HF086_003446 [Spodoptera exigua]|uniref:Uncharacterized protein n=1 Tax=Spodoptera exigua TaxID=7107 RepID=A0A922MHK2_SPOEX|nr:hypothetical protein HF086_003446 [Spodoptera exigua]
MMKKALVLFALVAFVSSAPQPRKLFHEHVEDFVDIIMQESKNVERNALARQSVSGRDLTSFTKDCIAVFPKDKLAALFDQKMAEDEEFKTAIENLESEECIKHTGAVQSASQNSGNDTRMMKQALVVLALVALAFSAPQSRKLFHEHVEDFLDIIMEEAGHEIEHLNEHYLEYDEFWAALDYIRTNNFKDLVYEMESLPEFVAVIEFLEQDNIDIHYFIDLFNQMIEGIQEVRSARHSTSGRDFTSFIRDCIDAFPKAKLSALFDQKMADDEEFSTAVTNLKSEQWDAVFSALWANPVFQAEVATLAENGIDVKVFLDEIVAIFGQN